MIHHAALSVAFVALVLVQHGANCSAPAAEKGGRGTSDSASANDEPKSAQPADAAAKSDEGVLLPNGWRLTPAGRQVLLTDLPLNIVTSADGKQALVATSGYNAHELTSIELTTGKKTAVETVNQSWFGLASDSKRDRFWWSGGGEG